MRDLREQTDLLEARVDEQKRLGQYFTAPWLAEAIVERYFGWLGSSDVVCEPSCGLGSFLNAIPMDVTAFGVEVDEAIAKQCEELTEREVIVSRFEDAELPLTPTAVIGNPPFEAQTIDRFLDRSHQLLPTGGQVGFILPAYMLQTASRVVRYAERWNLTTEMIPRNVYKGLSKPLVFTMFRKGRQRTLVGMAFYFEAAAVNELPAEIKRLFTEQGGPLWPRVIERALLELGGEGTLGDIYRLVQGNRPSKTPFWKEQIRKVLREKFVRVGKGTYAHPNRAQIVEPI